MSRVADLCDAAVRTVPVAGASASVLTEDGTGWLVSASDPTSERLDEIHFTTGEGPAFDAYRERIAVLVDDVTAAVWRARWPAFAGIAGGTAARAVYALPLEIGAIQTGVLVLYRADPGLLNDSAFTRAMRVADALGYALLDLAVPLAAGSLSSATPAPRVSDSQVDGAPGAAEPDEVGLRSAVHQATGMLKQRLGIPIDEALSRLRARAFTEGRSVNDVALDVVQRRIEWDE